MELSRLTLWLRIALASLLSLACVATETWDLVHDARESTTITRPSRLRHNSSISSSISSISSISSSISSISSISSRISSGIESHVLDNEPPPTAITQLYPDDFEMVLPVEVDARGAVVSPATRRRRRAATSSLASSSSPRYYRLRAHGGRELRLSLRPARSLLAPGLTVSVLGAAGSPPRTRPLRERERCFYRGSVTSDGVGDRTGTAALATCDGLSGLIRTPHGEFFISPLVPETARRSRQRHTRSATSPSGHAPHALYRRPDRHAEDARRRAEETRRRAEETRRRAEETRRRAEETRRRAEETRRRGEETQGRAEETRRRGEDARARAEETRGRAEETRERGEETRRRGQETRARAEETQGRTEETRRRGEDALGRAEETQRRGEETRARAEETQGRGEETRERGEETRKEHYCGRRKKYAPKPPGKDAFIHPDEFPFLPAGKSPHESPGLVSRDRGRRSPVSARPSRRGEATVETLVVVDPRMVANHGRASVSTYVLTILNIVSSLFRDGTIGSNINLVVVGLVLLEEDQPGLVINHHADQTLSSFCQWQSGVTAAGRHGGRHDHAVLLTGTDICSWKNEPCDTLGYAPISGMCSKFRSCTVNEDSGLGLAFTIAHESGHNFGMVHDGEGNLCKKSEGNIMAPTLAGNNGVFSWSPCSRNSLQRFLSSAQSLCLMDAARSVGELALPERLPGERYDADTQCKWQFGDRAKLCTFDFKKDICKALWCHKSGRRCETKFMPAAEGTSCGINKWCRRGQCLRHGDEGSRPIDGHWSPWSPWSACSRTCGGGVSSRERECGAPRPQLGGRYCPGTGRTFRLCEARACAPDAVDFRSLQCAEYNSRPFRGLLYDWKPYTRVEEQDICRLYCLADKFNFFFAMAGKVKDGTRCHQDRRDVCIEGVCEAVGCDNVLGSGALEDSCGVCRGNNASCQFVRGVFTSQQPGHGYRVVVMIPAGARSIHVSEVNISGCYLAARDARGRYHLTGGHTVDWPGRYEFAGAAFSYKRPYNNGESLSSAGPTNETLVIELLMFGKNPGISWEYTVPRGGGSDRTKVAAAPRHSYSWVVVRSTCNATCGRGKLTTRPVCLQDRKLPVNGSRCSHKVKPPSRVLPCNEQPCPPSWQAGDWAPCSRSCGGLGEQSRPVSCTQRVAGGRLAALPPSACPEALAPARSRPCNAADCPPAWVPGAWSQCSKTCGRGVRTRELWCRAEGAGGESRSVPNARCRGLARPARKEKCSLHKRCKSPQHLQWVLSAWSECSASCGVEAAQSRELRCGRKSSSSGRIRELPERRCHRVAKPSVALTRPCATNPGGGGGGAVPCPPGAAQQPLLPGGGAAPGPTRRSLISNALSGWYAAPWTQCAATCGGGEQTRSVRCLAQGKPAVGCQPHHKPATTRACNSQACPGHAGEVPVCQDHYTWCSLVPRHAVCSHPFYGKQCCQACTPSNLITR
ncbi:A disintegrin and metalloproteinase with thrombospondin motifs 16-like [Lampetra fluviatilis]